MFIIINLTITECFVFVATFGLIVMPRLNIESALTVVYPECSKHPVMSRLAFMYTAMRAVESKYASCAKALLFVH